MVEHHTRSIEFEDSLRLYTGFLLEVAGDIHKGVLWMPGNSKERRPMQELSDYSGQFDPKITYKDFSKELLLKALEAYADYMRKLQGTWYLTVKQQMNDDVASSCDRLVWDKMQVNDVEMTFKLLKIEGNDVAALFKSYQMRPWAWNLKHHFELKSPRHGIYTVTRCPSLLALEREGEGREQRICGQIEPELFRIRAHHINPQIKVTPLQLPPRRSPGEIACQWEYTLEE